jgi:hypothetical protein
LLAKQPIKTKRTNKNPGVQMFNVTKKEFIAPTIAMVLLSIGLQACNNDSGTPINIENPSSSSTDTGNSDVPSVTVNDPTVTITEADLDQKITTTAAGSNFEAELGAQLTGGSRVISRNNASAWTAQASTA